MGLISSLGHWKKNQGPRMAFFGRIPDLAIKDVYPHRLFQKGQVSGSRKKQKFWWLLPSSNSSRRIPVGWVILLFYRGWRFPVSIRIHKRLTSIQLFCRNISFNSFSTTKDILDTPRQIVIILVGFELTAGQWSEEDEQRTSFFSGPRMGGFAHSGGPGDQFYTTTTTSIYPRIAAACGYWAKVPFCVLPRNSHCRWYGRCFFYFFPITLKQSKPRELLFFSSLLKSNHPFELMNSLVALVHLHTEPLS